MTMPPIYIYTVYGPIRRKILSLAHQFRGVGPVALPRGAKSFREPAEILNFHPRNSPRTPRGYSFDAVKSNDLGHAAEPAARG